ALEERGGVPHHLFDIADPDRPLSAVEWAKLADDAIAGIAARGKHPIVTGGTGFYLRALVDGLFEAPPIDPEVRARLSREAAADLPALYARLDRVDPVAARQIQPADRYRIQRAREVFDSS